MAELLPADLVARLREDADCAPGRLHKSLLDAANEIERLRRGEFICSKCGLRKDGEKPDVDF